MGHPNLSQEGIEYRFKPGNKMSPGRPIGSKSIKARLKEFAKHPIPVKMPNGDFVDQEIADAIVLALLSKASKGDMTAIKEFFDRYEGKVADKVELTGKDGEALKIEQSKSLGEIYDGIAEAFNVTTKVIEEKVT